MKKRISAFARSMSLRSVLPAALLLSILPFEATLAADWYVDPAEVDSAACGSRSAPCRTISYTLSKIGYGDTVYLAPFITVSAATKPGLAVPGLVPIGGGNCMLGAPVVFHETDLHISMKVDLIGGGQRCTVIDGNGAGRILDITTGPVAISGITFRDGNAGLENGGAIRLMSGGSLSVTSSRFFDNSATNGGAIAGEGSAQSIELFTSTLRGNVATGDGGALYCIDCSSSKIWWSSLTDNSASSRGGAALMAGLPDAGVFRITHSLFERNEAGSYGGALLSSIGSLVVRDSEFVDNIADIYDGGAIYSFSSVEIDSSTFAENIAGRKGGAVYFRPVTSLRRFSAFNSTFSSNRADEGGALSINDGSPFIRPAVISSSTFMSNNADSVADHIWTEPEALELHHTIIHEVALIGPVSQACNVIAFGGEDNLLTDNTCGTGGGFNLGQASGVDGALADNGSHTRTHALLSTSNAIDLGGICTDAATFNGDLEHDQRGEERHVDYDLDGNPECDIGAFELAAP